MCVCVCVCLCACMCLCDVYAFVLGVFQCVCTIQKILDRVCTSLIILCDKYVRVYG